MEGLRQGIEYTAGQVLACPHFPNLRVRVTTAPDEHNFGSAEVCAVGGNGLSGQSIVAFRFDRRQMGAVLAGRPGAWRPCQDGDELTFPFKEADRHRYSLVVLVRTRTELFLVRNEEFLAYCTSLA